MRSGPRPTTATTIRVVKPPRRRSDGRAPAPVPNGRCVQTQSGFAALPAPAHSDAAGYMRRECQAGRAEVMTAHRHQLTDLLSLALVNYTRAQKYATDPDVMLVFLHQALVNSATALVNGLGFQVRGEHAHRVVFGAASRALWVDVSPAEARLFSCATDQIRRYRHDALYRRYGVVAGTSAEQMMADCRRWLPLLWAAVEEVSGVASPIATLDAGVPPAMARGATAPGAGGCAGHSRDVTGRTVRR